MSVEKPESSNETDSSVSISPQPPKLGKLPDSEIQRIEAASLKQNEKIEGRRLIRKVDIRLLPICATIYAFALIDRVG